LSGIEQITGDLTVENNGEIITLQSNTLETVGGIFSCSNLTILSTLSFAMLSSVGTINLIALPALNGLSFTAGITTASSAVVSDTFLNSLSGLDFLSIDNLNINNNGRLTEIDLDLANITGALSIQANGLGVEVSLPYLVFVPNATINNVTTFSVPSLVAVNGSFAFGSNYFTSFVASNLTAIGGSLSFIGNSDLVNISLPGLATVGGGVDIANNTDLESIDGFPVLQSIGGAMLLLGDFNNFTFPKLDIVKGAVAISSSGNISQSCTNIQQLKTNGDIQGQFDCTGNNAGAATSTSNSTGSSGGDSGSSSGTNNTAAGLHINPALLGLAAIGGFAQALW